MEMLPESHRIHALERIDDLQHLELAVP